MFFHFLVSSSISFIRVLEFSEYRSFTSLFRFIPRYHMVFGAIVNGIDSLISLSSVSLVLYRLCTLIFLKRFYLFIYLTVIETATERGNTSRGSGRGRSRLPAEEPDAGIYPRTLGSRPEPKADT